MSSEGRSNFSSDGTKRTVVGGGICMAYIIQEFLCPSRCFQFLLSFSIAAVASATSSGGAEIT